MTGKRFLSVFLTAVLILANLSVVNADVNIGEYAEIVFTPSMEKVNAEYIWQDNMNPKFVEKEGRWGWEIQPAEGPRQFYIKIDDNFMYNLSNQPVAVEIDYFDEGTGQFGMRYGLQEGVLPPFDLPYVVLNDTKQWKTHTYYLEDASMANNVRNLESLKVDVCVATLLSGKALTVEKVVLGAVRIRYVEWKTPVEVDFSENHPGDNYFPENGDKLGLNLTNRYDTAKKVKMQYTVKNDLNEVVFNGEEELSFEGKEQKYKDLSKEINKFGLYTMDVSSFDEEGTLLDTKSFKFALLTYTPKDAKNEYLSTGIHTDRREDNKKMFELYDKGGMGWMRLDSRWDFTEKERGLYTVHEKTQQAIDFAYENGIEPLLIMHHRNGLYDSNYPKDENSLSAFSRYCEFMASHFKGKVKYFEAPNEINFYVTDPEHFFNIQKAAYEGIKRGNPDAVYVGFDLAGVDLAFTEKVFQLGVLDYMDVYSLHVYQNYAQPEKPDMHEQLHPIRELLEKYGKPDMEIWMTEMGWITYDNLTQSRTERQVGSYLIRLTSLFQAKDSIDKFFWYEFQNDGRHDTAQECCFGMIRSGEWVDCNEPYPYSAKTTYAAMCSFNKIIGSSECVDYKVIDEDTYAIRYKRADGKDAIILWTIDHRKNLQLDLGCTSGELYDMFGNKTCDLSSVNGTFSFLLSGEPVYFVGNFPKFEESNGGIELDRTYTESVMGDVSDFVLTKTIDTEMKVDVEPFPGVDLLENSGFNGNNAKISFTLNEDAHIIDYTKQASDREANRIRLNVTSGDKTYLTGELQCLAKEPILAEFGGSEMYKGTYLNRWQGSATVTNNSTQQKVSGKLVVDSPKELADFIGTLSFDEIEPGKTIELRFNFPEMVEKEIIPMTAHIETSNGYKTEISRNMNFVYANYAETKPKIDGVLSEGEWITGIMRTNKPTPLTAYPNFGKLWKGVNDLSGTYGMLWDEEYCYFYGDVTDDVFYQPYFNANMWMGDSIQIGITDTIGLNMDKAVNRGTNDSGVDYSKYTELTAGLTGDGATVWRHRTVGGKPLSKVENIEAKIVRNGVHTVYEMKIPWEEIVSEDAVMEPNDVVAMSLLVNENDKGGRLGYLEYGSGLGSNKDTRKFCSIILLKNKK